MSLIYLVIGVAGSGKTTLGRLLAQRLGLPFYDADDFHPEANIRKMRQGHALNDADRLPWLQSLADHIREWEQTGGAVLACSALKETYRQILMGDAPERITWIYLDASRELIRQRLAQRGGHFFPAQLLDSQFEALEVPAYGLHVDAGEKPEQLVELIVCKD